MYALGAEFRNRLWSNTIKLPEDRGGILPSLSEDGMDELTGAFDSSSILPVQRLRREFRDAHDGYCHLCPVGELTFHNPGSIFVNGHDSSLDRRILAGFLILNFDVAEERLEEEEDLVAERQLWRS